MVVAFVLLLLLFVSSAICAAEYAGIEVIDEATDRGVPLVELETVHHVRYVTDSAGRIAIDDADLIGRETFFSVHSHGYSIPADGFRFRGVRLKLKRGETTKVRIHRENIAERLCRLTGEGRFHDSKLLGHEIPTTALHEGHVAGQDSVQAVPYRDRIYWFWGDTQRLSYPLGLFRTAGATTPTIGQSQDFNCGLPFRYFTDDTGFARAMMPLPERTEGVIWIDGVAVVPDARGKQHMVAHYTRRKGLEEQLEHGIAQYNDAAERFVPAVELPLAESWRHLHGHPAQVEVGGVAWLYCGRPALNVRVRATLNDVLDVKRYEAFTCLDAEGVVQHDAAGAPNWRWQAELPPPDAVARAMHAKVSGVPANESLAPMRDATDEKTYVRLHNGTVRWNPHRCRWILIAGEIGGTSHLGEVWYSEAKEPTGPWLKAVKIVSHERMSFYNVCHHDFLDRDGGRIIHFEGTYTRDFSGNPSATPRYEYNQVLYRLDLDDPRLSAAR
jgi:hypothetical protein